MFGDFADGVIEGAAAEFVNAFNSMSDHLEVCKICDRQTGDAEPHREGCAFAKFEAIVKRYDRVTGSYWKE